MITIRSLASGSSGNALLIHANDETIAVDCGIGPRLLGQGLRPFGIRLADLHAVLLTHEHTDHVRALPQLAAARVAILATPGTARATRLPHDIWQPVRVSHEVKLGTFLVTPLAVSHDAAEPCGYFITTGDTAIVVITDLGEASPALVPYLAAADLIVLEANHDLEMLRCGPYPAHLKRRVLSARGHLSNDDCGRLLATALADSRKSPEIWLAHLSTTNNRPELAREAVAALLAAAGYNPPVRALPRFDQNVEWRSTGRAAAPAQLHFGAQF